MDQNGYSFLIMVKGMKDFIRDIIEKNQGDFENSRGRYIDRYDVYGTTLKRFLCEGDTKKGTFIFITVTEKLTVKSRRSSRGYTVWKNIWTVVLENNVCLSDQRSGSIST